MKRIAFLSVVLIMFYVFSYGQEGKLEFTYKKVIDDGYTVYFHVKGIKDESHADEILADLLNDNNVSFGRHFKSIEGKDRFQLNINSVVTAEYIRQILKTHDVDYDFSTVSIDGVVPNKKTRQDIKQYGSIETYVTALGFPKYVHTGDKISDDINYSQAKEKWINENPEEYNNMLKELEEKNK
jgi:hypothetical protein